jgi:hypothetical protein
MLEKLWNDIRLIYDGFNFSSRLLVNDLMIISKDNHYLLYYKQDDISTQIRIEKQYDLVKMWSDDNEVDMTNYKIHVEVSDSTTGIDVVSHFALSSLGQIYTSENSMIELSYKVLTPFLREVKLKEIGI